MSEISTKVKLDLRSLEQLIENVSVFGQPAHDRIMIRWLVRYKKYAQTQFRKNSKGGGSWPPLSKRTKKRVRKRSRQILRDSDTLFHMLDPIPTLDRFPMPGIATTATKGGITISFGGRGRHPIAKMSVAKLATIHHLGRGNNPERKILPLVTDRMRELMAKDAREVFKQTKKSMGIK